MGKVAIKRPKDLKENLKLTINKFQTIGIAGEASAGKVRVCLTADWQVRDIRINPKFKEEASLEELQASLKEALQNSIHGIIDMRKAEIHGRLNNNHSYTTSLDIIQSLLD